MDLSESTTEQYRQRRVPKVAVFLMLVIAVCLTMLAVFGNVQRFWRGDAEVVVTRRASLPTPGARAH
jgi:hypothetical protein